ncbi:MAG: TRC40/GET3/ArsA family transport-energizing ATPase [Actinomycetota bacterium]
MIDPAARVLLVTGKGGVGKTTVAAATALRCAELGLRTLVVSTDTAHSLADALDLGDDAAFDEAAEVAPNLQVRQLDARRVLERVWGDARTYLAGLMGTGGLDRVRAEELSVLPGLDEVVALAELADHVDDPELDVVVVDCAPSAETIRLLAAPEVLAWWMRRLRPQGDELLSMAGPLAEQFLGIRLPEPEVLTQAEELLDRLDRVRAVLQDPQRTSARLVVVPERLIVAEARRTHTYLSLFGHHVDAVIANRILPDELDAPGLAGWRQVQARELDTIAEGFAPLPVLRLALADDEPVGIEALAALGIELYDDDPTARLHEGRPISVLDDGHERVLVLALGAADEEEVDLGRRGDDLYVRVGTRRRVVTLPDTLRTRPVVGARLRDGSLSVRFGTPRSDTASA